MSYHPVGSLPSSPPVVRAEGHSEKLPVFWVQAPPSAVLLNLSLS